MNAIIVGCGMVGSELARTLVNDGHSVSVIDNHQKPLEQIGSELDVMTYYGDGSDIELLREAGIGDTDIFIAVSPSDESNLLACLMAKEEANCETIARVRNPMYSKETDFIIARLGLSKAFNPEHLAATEIYNLLQYPALSRLDFFEGGSVVIAVIHVNDDFKYIGVPLGQMMSGSEGLEAIVCAAVRGNDYIIPKGDFVIQAGDDITVVTRRDDLRPFIKAMGIKNTPAENILIVGCGNTTYYLVQDLIRKKKNVRIIEEDEKKCDIFSERFPEAEIIRGDGTDRRFLMRHGLAESDAFVPLTSIDEENLVIATFAKRYYDTKVITRLTRTDMNDLIKTLNVDSVVFPKLLCADIIAQYVRAKEAGAGGHVATLFRYLDEAFEIVELNVGNDRDIVGKPLKNLKLKKDIILAGIISDNVYEVPRGGSVINPGDSIIVVTTEKGLTDVRDILR